MPPSGMGEGWGVNPQIFLSVIYAFSSIMHICSFHHIVTSVLKNEMCARIKRRNRRRQNLRIHARALIQGKDLSVLLC